MSQLCVPLCIVKIVILILMYHFLLLKFVLSYFYVFYLAVDKTHCTLLQNYQIPVFMLGITCQAVILERPRYVSPSCCTYRVEFLWRLHFN
ncbi:hypothetical protein [Diadegma fenestrale ichnovirus]|nr:hypothetical protein [Diadegma fenestrale ichnovirus]